MQAAGAMVPLILAANLRIPPRVQWEEGAVARFKIHFDLNCRNNVQTLISANDVFGMECTNAAWKTDHSILCEISNYDADDENASFFRQNITVERIPFEVKFSKRGIERIRMEKDQDRKRVTLLKKILALFNLGVDLRETEDQLPKFEALAQTVLGECKTNYSFARNVTGLSYMGTSMNISKEYEQFMLPLLKLNAEKVLIIDKDIDMMECDKEERYFNEYIKTADLSADWKSRSIHMKIPDKGFIEIWSYTKGFYSFEEKQGVKKLAIYETLHVHLDSFDKPQQPLPELKNPMTTTLLLDDFDQ